MLTDFTVRRTFNKLRVSLTVDCVAKEVSGVVTYDRRIVRLIDNKQVPYHTVGTPDLAERWFSKPVGERGSMIEHLEWMARTDQLQPEKEAA